MSGSDTLARVQLRRYVGLFAFLMALALIGYLRQDARGQSPGTMPGTLPGTLPSTSIPFTHGLVAVIHTATTANLVVDICTQAGVPVAGLTGIGYLQRLDVALQAGTYDWKVAVAGTNCATLYADLLPFTLGAGGEILVLVTGGDSQAGAAVIVPVKAGNRLYYLPLVHENIKK